MILCEVEKPAVALLAGKHRVDLGVEEVRRARSGDIALVRALEVLDRLVWILPVELFDR